ncbi:MAG: PilZ domain-containing protein [Candidatus Omnitrophica bacterium]|nr:PilZ domain-containing protein [Candidatus Omnitrophota bacterium]MBU0895106.1 PilZ domain-containing protein [Candidatus Omnitrophota bacterium]MBU1037973.1 PilZ domain-containing protein [Candidatus Omnitrophota bacterium]MBU1808803.1 PilZ domain-containing protein [Candidatus Omnitrophota bacterium]
MNSKVDNLESVENKRRYKRVDFSVPVVYKNLRVPTELPVGSVTRNLSEGGVCFQTSKFISLACRLVVEISIPTVLRPIKAISKVAWIRRIPLSDQYELGNQFLEITKEDKANILSFVNQSLSVDTQSPSSTPAPNLPPEI